MITFCIDAGTQKNCGLALFLRMHLVAVRLIDGAMPSSARAFALDVPEVKEGKIMVCQVVLEVPRVYPGQKARADANDLIKLAVAGARVAQTIADAAVLHVGCEVGVTSVAPSDWKAQTDPDIMCERVLARLDDAERAVVDKVFTAHGKKGMPKSLRHNVIDAVGMGLWHLGRMRPGGAGR